MTVSMAMAMQAPKDPKSRAGAMLAHLSDPHLPLSGGVPLRAVLNKRLLGLLSWHLKRHRRHRPETLTRLIADLRCQSPDLIAVTGDLTNLGLDSEYRAARTWLEGLGDPRHVMVIPGNHEALIDGAWDRGAASWQPYWQGDEALRTTDVAQAFPVLRRRGPLALIGTSSAIATPLGFASGEMGKAQLDRLAALLRRTRSEGLFRVLMIHHPPLDGTVVARKHLRDGAALRALLQTEGVELVLHGHSHRSHQQSLTTRDGSVPVIGVPSASSMHHEAAAYNLYNIVPTDTGWSVTLTTRRLGEGQKMETGRCVSLTIPRPHAACAS